MNTYFKVNSRRDMSATYYYSVPQTGVPTGVFIHDVTGEIIMYPCEIKTEVKKHMPNNTARYYDVYPIRQKEDEVLDDLLEIYLAHQFYDNEMTIITQKEFLIAAGVL